jgi:predicted permease
VALDGGGIVFARLTAVVAAGLAGLVPAIAAARPGLVPLLRASAAAATADQRTARTRSGLVIAQVALSLVLLVAAGLFARSLGRARALDPGFDAEGLLLASLDLFPAGYDEERGRELYPRLLDEVEALPGVAGATLARRLALDFAGLPSATFAVDGYAPAAGEEVSLVASSVGPRYFEVMRAPLVEGRDFDRRDRPGAPLVAIVNQTAAQRYWPRGGAVGGVLRAGDRAYTVVGVGRDGKYRTLAEEPQPAVFLPLLQGYRSEVVLHVRAAAVDARLVSAVQGAVERLDRNLPLYAVKSMNEHLGIAVMPQRLAAGFLGLFGAVAAGLAGLGLYGVVAYVVGRRGRELGLRLALGARPRDLRWMVLSQGLRLTAAGCALGLAGALAGGRLMGGLLLGVSPNDLTVFAAVPAFLTAVALLACDLPARRAGRTDPLKALRED